MMSGKEEGVRSCRAVVRSRDGEPLEDFPPERKCPDYHFRKSEFCLNNGLIRVMVEAG